MNLWGLVLAGVLLLCGLQTVRLAREQTLLATEKAERSQDKAEAQAMARGIERRYRAKEADDARKAMDLERAAQAAAAAGAVRAAAAQRSAAGLRSTVEELNAAARGRGLPGAAACPGEFEAQRSAAIRARDLLGACTAQYQELAAEADAVALKLSTALQFIDLSQQRVATP